MGKVRDVFFLLEIVGVLTFLLSISVCDDRVKILSVMEKKLYHLFMLRFHGKTEAM